MLNLISGINLETYVKDLKSRSGSQGKITKGTINNFHVYWKGGGWKLSQKYMKIKATLPRKFIKVKLA